MKTNTSMLTGNTLLVAALATIPLLPITTFAHRAGFVHGRANRWKA